MRYSRFGACRAPQRLAFANRIIVLISSIDGQPVSGSIATAGDDAFSELVQVYAGNSLKDGYTVEGTMTFDPATTRYASTA